MNSVQQLSDVHDVLQSVIAICVPSIPYLLHCIHLNIISHVAALSAIGIGEFHVRSVSLSVCRSVGNEHVL